MGKRKTASKKQPTITEHALPLLKKPMEQLGKQIDVPGNHWQGRMSDEERGTMYGICATVSRCTSLFSSRCLRTSRTRPMWSNISRAQ